MSPHLFLLDLKNNISGDLLSDEFSLGMYASDASLYQIKPIAVVLPKDENDVKTALKIAADHQVTVLPRGGGTSLAGQTVGHSLILDFSKYMNKILEFSEEERWINVQPGLVRDELNLFLKPYGLHFAPDPATSSRANVGGMVGNNSSGTKSILYGKTVDHLLEIKGILADGTPLHTRKLPESKIEELAAQDTREGIIYRKIKNIVNDNKPEIEKRFPKVMRRVGGYNLDEFIHTQDWNLSKLLCGSEGTLTVMTEVKLNLVPLPKYKSVCVAHFHSIGDSVRAVAPILEFSPSAVEILDKTVIELSKENLETRRHCHFVEGSPEAVLLVEFYGDTKEDVLSRPAEMAKKLTALSLGYAFPIFPEGAFYNDAWMIRKKGLGLMLGIKGNKKPIAFIEDAAIPLKHLPEYLERVLAVCAKYDTKAAAYAHASVGVIHVRPILDMRLQEDIDRMKNIAAETLVLVMEYGGSWSGEHGDGLVRSPFNEQFFGSQIYQLFKEIKTLFDPENRMNPGKIVDAIPMDQNLRYGTKYKDKPVETLFKYQRELTFEHAVHTCNGVGECRKMNGGTMCPSFRATKDEEHSTRGRANALRLAMSGQLGEDGLDSERLHQVMDLCLSCKACKSECPSNVDMAKLKSEVAQQYFDTHGIGLRDRMIKQSSVVAKRFSGPFAPLVNWVQNGALFKNLLQYTAGMDARRTLPEYARKPFYQWFNKNYTPKKVEKKVVLFADTYLNYYEPDIGISATKLLNDCGYEVILANVGCCQRPLLSHGFIREAKEEGTRVAQRLDVYLKEGLTIVACEPSCASALNDDLPDLIEDEELAKRLSSQVMMIDQFLQKEIESGNLQVKLKTTASELLLHGHCHQKALYGTKPMHQLLEESTKIKEIDSGCCGMAGSFGYEKEHYELSQKIGESVLFPAIRANEASTVIACGFSCRHQIGHFTGKKAKHWVEVVEVSSQEEKT